MNSMKTENQVEHQVEKQREASSESAYLYVVMPFYIVSDQEGGLFADSVPPDVSQDQLFGHASALGKEIKPFCSKDGGLPGDFSKYYGFMESHFGGADMSKGFSVFHLNASLLKPAEGFEKCKNLNAQFQKGARLGQSPIAVENFESPVLTLNSLSGIGYFSCGLKVVTQSDNSILEELGKTEFFRNIGWRRGQKGSKSQSLKHGFVFDLETEEVLTFHDLLNCYLGQFSKSIRFYQDRASVLYCATSVEDGSKENEVLCELAYEIIRIPDRNAVRFSQKLVEPSIHRVGRNVAFTALNEGALVIETVNDNKNKTIANKYFPAFFLALNQREVLLSTMQKIVQLEPDKLKSLDSGMFQKMENLRNALLILQLKQIFYSVSNVHEVELFFNQLQKVFAVEKMLLENEQSIREMYNLLEVKRNEEASRMEKEQAAAEEKRANIINTILGAIGCLGLFSFLKDVFPFYTDPAYEPWYRVISIVTPVVVMGYIVRLVFYSKE